MEVGQEVRPPEESPEDEETQLKDMQKELEKLLKEIKEITASKRLFPRTVTMAFLSLDDPLLILDFVSLLIHGIREYIYYYQKVSKEINMVFKAVLNTIDTNDTGRWEDLVNDIINRRPFFDSHDSDS